MVLRDLGAALNKVADNKATVVQLRRVRSATKEHASPDASTYCRQGLRGYEVHIQSTRQPLTLVVL
jgi:hypothetical protein